MNQNPERIEEFQYFIDGLLKFAFQKTARIVPVGLSYTLPWTQDVNWMHIRRWEDVLDVVWKSYVR